MKLTLLVLVGTILGSIDPGSGGSSIPLFTSLLAKTAPRVSFTPLDLIPNYHQKPVLESRRQFLIEMAREAWKPLLVATSGSHQPQNLANLLSAMSTLWLMDLKQEFNRAKEMLQLELDYYNYSGLGNNGDNYGTGPKYSENVLREGPGALLSLYVLTGDEFFLDKAQDLAELYQLPDLKPANLERILKYWTSNRLEARYLTDFTGDQQYWAKMEQVQKYLDGTKNLADQWKLNEEGLITQVKSFVQSNGYRTATTHDLLHYFTTIDQYLESGFLQYYPALNLTQVRSPGTLGAMTTRQCLYGATLALGAAAMPRVKSGVPEAQRHWELAESLTETCHLAANTSGLPYGEFRVNQDGFPLIQGWGSYWLESQIAETYFVLHRLTGHDKYREYAWDLAQAIKGSGSSGPKAWWTRRRKPAMGMRGQFPDQETDQVLGRTLKYLYLTMAPEDLLPLDKWVLTSGGQPLPVCGKNSAYPRSLCSK